MDQQTIQAYNQNAQNYDDETADFWDKFPRTFFDKFAELARGRILDVGCGPGRDGMMLKERGLEVTCLDASDSMVALCKERGLHSVIGDFLSMPFTDNSFDGAWAYTSLLHVPKTDVDIAFNEIGRVIKENGILGLGLIEGEAQEYRESTKVKMPRWFSYYTKEEVEKLLAKHNFKILYFETFKPNSKNYLNFIARKV